MILILLAQVAVTTTGISGQAQEWGKFSEESSFLLPKAEATRSVIVSVYYEYHGSEVLWTMAHKRTLASGNQILKYANSKNCPNMILVLNKINNLRMPKYFLPGFRNYPSSIVTTDMPNYNLSGLAYNPQSEHGDKLNIMGGPKSSVGIWVKYALNKLNTCWK